MSINGSFDMKTKSLIYTRRPTNKLFHRFPQESKMTDSRGLDPDDDDASILFQIKKKTSIDKNNYSD